ncbi:MAG: hypothetical protein KatS3mg109_2227 [Pirellulaceae bacterium]|nr:MAG: hypothetical protein KatS3mg109_2227 [Pirellulaceae bacterium]
MAQKYSLGFYRPKLDAGFPLARLLNSFAVFGIARKVSCRLILRKLTKK